MPTAIVLSSGGGAAPSLAADLRAVGFETSDCSDCTVLLQDVIKTQPDLVVCFQQSPDAALFEASAAVALSSARPVIVFTTDPDADKIAMATRAGVHAYIVDGYARGRLRSIVHLARARFEQEHALRRELAELRTRFEERKLVDRAKGILMGAQHLREAEAFKALRDTAMSSKQRIGQVSQTVIDAARYGEAMNRAGQLRMLSQRVVKLYALGCPPGDPAESAELLSASVLQVNATLNMLDGLLSKRTFGDLVAALRPPWLKVEAALRPPCRVTRLAEVDALAEAVLALAERLAANLEVAAYAPALGVINTVGRQRMLSQRLAKESLMQWLGAAPAARPTPDGTATLREFLAGLDYLTHLPLSNAEITRELASADEVWQRLKHAMAALPVSGASMRVAEASETLLGHFDTLTDQLERGIQAFVR